MCSKSTQYAVLICTYNGSNYIKEQIDSILSQTKSVNKIFIYDFQSTDCTVEIIREIQKSNPHILLTELKNLKSVTHSFINAIVHVSNKIEQNTILYICDQDDFWLPYKNEIISKYNIEKNEYPIMIHHDVLLTNANLKVLNKEFYSTSQKNLLCSNTQHREFFSTTIGHTICLNFQSIQIIKKLEFNKFLKMHDWYWSIIIERLGKVIFIDKKLSLYRQHQNNHLGINKSNNFLKKFHNGMVNSFSTAKQRYFINSQISGKTKKPILIWFLIRNFHFQEFIILLFILLFSNVVKNKP